MLQEATQSTPPSIHLQQRYSSLVWSCLDANLIRSAVFYAERYYVTYTDNHDARHLYAIALLRSGQPHSANHLVDLPPDSRCAGCLELKSRCCTALGRHRQAREALEQMLGEPTHIPSTSMGPRTSSAFPPQAALHCQAGMTAMKGHQPEEAASSFRQALKLDPMLWDAFEGLCALGDIPEIDEIYPPRPVVTNSMMSSTSQTQVPIATGAGFFTPVASGSGNLFFNPIPAGPRDSIGTVDSSFYPEDSFRQSQLRPSRSQPATTLAVLPPAVRPLSSADETGPVAKKPRSTRQRTAPPSTTAAETNIRPSKSVGALLQGADDRSKSSKTTATSRSTMAMASKGSREQQPAPSITRRSSRLLSGAPSKPTQPAKTSRDRRRAPVRTLSHSDSDMDEEPMNTEALTPPTPFLVSQTPEQSQSNYEAQMADNEIYELTRIFASASRALALYDCKLCMDELENLPTKHKRSAWVMAMVGKAHYELGEYAEAQRAFEAVRNLEPYRLWDMEVYSTLLWHQQQSIDLSFLAQELVSIDPRSSQAWIAVGNCFSLQKERAQALTCFRRALQLDSACAYAYTLSGHESIDEDLEKAIGFFQSALRADPRHYNAWYGLGTCYMRMSKLRLADYHYRKAVTIHPRSAVLLGCVGMIQERTGNLQGALGLFDQAVRISPENALVRYHRAKIYIAMKRYSAAVADLEALRDTSPDESNVIFQLARVYRLMGNKVKATQLLAVVRDVSPKSVSKIRKLLDTEKDDDVMDEG
ncbi:Tetratricopeptide-like helical domain superfamily protein [Abortiporus biennis]